MAAKPAGGAVGKKKRATIKDDYKRVRKRARAAAEADTEHHDAALHATVDDTSVNNFLTFGEFLCGAVELVAKPPTGATV